MSKPYPALCVDCRWSEPDKNSPWQLRCLNAVVNADDEWALSAVDHIRGTTCSTERGRTGWFAPCGKKGKQWTALSAAAIRALKGGE